jgi:hypothetical protein
MERLFGARSRLPSLVGGFALGLVGGVALTLWLVGFSVFSSEPDPAERATNAANQADAAASRAESASTSAQSTDASAQASASRAEQARTDAENAADRTEAIVARWTRKHSPASTH